MNDEPVNPTQEEAVATDSEVAQDEAFNADEYSATQGLIARLSEQLDELTTKQKDARQMLKNVFENDEELSEVTQQSENIKQQVKGRKDKLNESQEVVDLKVKIADITEDIKMVKESLNTHLLNYYQMTGTTTLDLPGGEEREFKVAASLKPRKK